jgi:hypothetical protein
MVKYEEWMKSISRGASLDMSNIMSQKVFWYISRCKFLLGGKKIPEINGSISREISNRKVESPNKQKFQYLVAEYGIYFTHMWYGIFIAFSLVLCTFENIKKIILSHLWNEFHIHQQNIEYPLFILQDNFMEYSFYVRLNFILQDIFMDNSF